jgi:hypothetical protein
VLVLTGGLVASGSRMAVGEQARQSSIPAAVPASTTPAVNNGVVYSIAAVGSTIFLGGSFTSVSPPGSSAVLRDHYIAAFAAGTGKLVTSFRPVVNGRVSSVIPGPRAGTVYIGGDFTRVDGRATRIALLNATTGAIAAGWKPPRFSNSINALVRTRGRLFVAGSFKKVGSVSRRGLASLNPRTGALTRYSTLAFLGHHNFGVHCRGSGCASGRVGVRALAANPAGTRLVALGDFTAVNHRHRDQVAMIKLGASAARVDTRWATDAFTASCNATTVDSYVRDVQFSPDGSYFVIVATGGSGGFNTDRTPTSCDSATRFSAVATGSDVRPTWIDRTGRDSLWSVSLTGTAVYVGGHARWMNNFYGPNAASEGAVPRPGLAALDPVNGLPLAWNPGRNPRGLGAYALLTTAHGLYVGSDTDYIGNRAYQRARIAYFPLAGGTRLPINQTDALPGNVYLVGGGSSPSQVRYVQWNDTAPDPPNTLDSDIDWSTVRGAFDLNGEVYYGTTSGEFVERTFDGTTFGDPVDINPYDDPAWDNVKTGSGQTYQGVPADFYSTISSLTSMFYTNGRLYYTLQGDSRMHWRWFEPDSGVIGAQTFTTTDKIDWADIAGAFLSGDTLYYADSTSGHLLAVHFSQGEPSGGPTTVNSSFDWASDGSFVLSNPVAPGS